VSRRAHLLFLSLRQVAPRSVTAAFNSISSRVGGGSIGMDTNDVADLVDSLVLGCCGRCVLLRPWLRLDSPEGV
jgi:hypothetical protein